MTENVRQPATRRAAHVMPPPTADIEFRQLPKGVVLIRVLGSIDVRVAPGLENRLIDAALAGQDRPPCLLLDLSGVTFLDHAGLDALLHFQDRIVAAAGTVELLAPSPSVVRLLHEAELDGESWMTFIPDPPDAF